MTFELQHLSTFLGVSCDHLRCDPASQLVLIQNGKTQLRGQSAVAKHLVQKAKKNSLLGTSAVDKAFVDQWLEYKVTVIDRSQSSAEIETCLKNLNSYLSDKVYFVGHQLTLADVVVFYASLRIVENLSFYEKQKYRHFSRWFNQVQNVEGVRNSLAEIPFQRNDLYTIGMAH